MIDHYARSAEFVDILMASHWPALAPVLGSALHGASGPIVDVGAGGGHGTAVIASAVPEAEIYAVEPSPGLRAILLARAALDPGLRERVTVLPEDLLRAGLPDRIGALVAMNVIGHFSPEERSAVWGMLAERLLPGGRAVVNIQPPTEPVTVPESSAGRVRVGRREYEVLVRAEPDGPERLVWHMAYRTHHDGRCVDRVEVTYPWWLLDEGRLAAEVAAWGFDAEAAAPGIYIVRRQGAS